MRWFQSVRAPRSPQFPRRGRGGSSPRRSLRRHEFHAEALEPRQMLSVTPPVITLGTGVADGATLDEAIQPSGVVRVQAQPGTTVIAQFVGSSGAVVEKRFASVGAAAFPVTLSPADVASLRDGLTQASVWVIDAASRAVNRVQAFTIDTTVPTPVITLGAGVADGATQAEATQAGGLLAVTAERGRWTTVQLYGADDPSAVVVKQFWGAAPAAVPVVLTLEDLAVLGRGPKYASVWVTDAAGNPANAFATFTLDLPAAGPLPQLSVVPLDGGVTEGRGFIDFFVMLSAPAVLPVTVSCATADGTARVSDQDYRPIAGQTLTFAPGEMTKTVRVTVINDAKVEEDETFWLALSNPRGATVATPLTAATIRNDDSTSISVSSAAIVEGDAGVSSLVFTVTLSAPSAFPVYVLYATADGTATAADRDYAPVATPQRLMILPGVTATTIEIPVTGDTKEETDESFTLVLSAPVNATLATATAVGTIRTDDWRTVSVAGVSRAEGNTGSSAFSFRLTLSAASIFPVSVRYVTADGTATAADWDYQPVSKPQQLTFQPGETEKTVGVTVYGDLKAEGDETFSLVVSDPVNALLEKPVASATIRNDDVPAIGVSAEPLAEGDSGTSTLSFRVALSAPSTLPVTVSCATADGTATTADQDYVPFPTQQLTFAPGETVKIVAVSVNGDTKIETDESFSLVLWNPVNAALATASFAATIRNDDVPVVSVAGGEIPEGDSGTVTLPFTVSLSAPSPTAVTVRYSTADGTATVADQDYQPVVPSQLLTFAPGETVKTVGVKVNGDTKAENDETFMLVLLDPTGASVGTSVATGTIRNDDAAPPPTPQPPPSNTGTWTIMVYMTGENLNTFARDDVNEMERFVASLPANSGVSIVVSWDQPMAAVGTAYATGNNSQAAWRTYGRGVIQADTTSTIATTFDLSPGEKNTGDPATLVEFMKWGAQQRPASNYVLQLWGHGGGLDGSQFDSESGGIFNGDALTIAELAGALGSAGVPPLKLVSYDNCLMAMAEVGFAAAERFTGHFVASEELVAGAGQNYVTAYGALLTAPGQKTSADIGAGMVASFQTQYAGKSTDTFSSVATSGYTQLATTLKQFVIATDTLGSTDRNTMRSLITASPSLSFDEASFRDLGRFMARVAASTLPQSVRAAATAVGNAVTAMVTSKTNDSRANSGIAIYLPTSAFDWYLSSYSATAAAFCNATNWDRFARWVATGNRSASAVPPAGPAPGPSPRRTAAAPTYRR